MLRVRNRISFHSPNMQQRRLSRYSWSARRSSQIQRWHATRTGATLNQFLLNNKSPQRYCIHILVWKYRLVNQQNSWQSIQMSCPLVSRAQCLRKRDDKLSCLSTRCQSYLSLRTAKKSSSSLIQRTCNKHNTGLLLFFHNQRTNAFSTSARCDNLKFPVNFESLSNANF